MKIEILKILSDKFENVDQLVKLILVGGNIVKQLVSSSLEFSELWFCDFLLCQQLLDKECSAIGG